MKYSKYIPIISLIGDFVILNTLFVLAFVIRHPYVDDHFSDKHLLFYIYLNFAWFVLFFVFGANNFDRSTRKKAIMFTYIRIIVFFFFIFLMYFQLTPLQYYPRSSIKYLFSSFSIAIIVWKFVLYYAFYYYRKKGYNFRNVVILGYGNRSKELARYFKTNPWHGYRFLGFFDNTKNNDKDIVGGWEEFQPFLENNHVNEVYISWGSLPTSVIHKITEIITEYPISVRIIPDLAGFSYKNAEMVNYGLLPVMQMHPGPLSMWYNRLLKRAFDIFVSFIMLAVVVSWVTVVLYIATLFGGRKEGLFFKQKRTCVDGKVFTCYKFRTMARNKDAHHRQATKDDQRITSVGRFLRRWSIDELPQFFNVLKGDMSVVGPRPHMLKHTEEYQKLVRRFMLRHTIKPGITGLAQVNGYRGEIKKPQDIKKRVQFDVNYVENWSFNMDLKIILLTVWVLVKGQERAY